jgi:hypothetical protein
MRLTKHGPTPSSRRPVTSQWRAQPVQCVQCPVSSVPAASPNVLDHTAPWATFPVDTSVRTLVGLQTAPRDVSTLTEPSSPITTTLPIMAAPDAMTSLVKSSAALISRAHESLPTSLAAMKTAETAPSSTFGILGRVILSILSVLPTLLFWVSYTLPTWLFTLFSMSLTFTMNFTTL